MKHIHIVGVCGTFMGGIAAIAKEAGFKVTGCDANVYPPMSTQLEAMGIELIQGFDATQVQINPDIFVIGNVAKRGNPLIEEILNKNLPYISGPQWLYENILCHSWTLAVAGTHGKTTTTSLTASILAAAGMDPTFVIGGKLTAAGSNAKLGQGEYMVAEADESDASFLYLSPVLAVVTNIDEDHMDTYEHDIEKLYQAFVNFLNGLPFYGCAFVCLESAHVRNILPRIKKPFNTYGLTPDADLYASDILACGAQMRFMVNFKNTLQKPFEVVLNIPGEHNVLNALAAIGMALECHVPVGAIQKGLHDFGGVGRRFQQYGEIALPQGGYCTLIDDYGHHPVEMKATLLAARNAFPDKRLVLVFQPHRYTRTRDLFEDFVSVLNMADALILTEVYAAGETPIKAADSRALMRAIRVLGKQEPVYVEDIREVPEAILTFAENGDVVITMGAGSIGGVCAKVTGLAKKELL